MNPVAAGGVVAPDYYAIGKSVAGTIAKVCRPLTREQRTALTGALSVWLDAADQRTTAAQAEADRLRNALQRIERWFGEFPETGERWPSGEPISYGAQFGSNGERDYMRGIARAAIHAAKTEQERGE